MTASDDQVQKSKLMEWSEEHDVLFLREMPARSVFGAKKEVPLVDWPFSIMLTVFNIKWTWGDYNLKGARICGSRAFLASQENEIRLWNNRSSFIIHWFINSSHSKGTGMVEHIEGLRKIANDSLVSLKHWCNAMFSSCTNYDLAPKWFSLLRRKYIAYGSRCLTK